MVRLVHFPPHGKASLGLTKRLCVIKSKYQGFGLLSNIQGPLPGIPQG